MIAYIFNKADRKVINKVENVVGINSNSIFSNEITYILSENNDFIISDTIYNFGDIIPTTKTNKNIKTELETLKENQALIQGALDDLIFGGGL